MTLAQPSPDWMDRALCAQVDPELWFPEKGERSQAALDVCHRCPVQAECLAFALETDQRFGTWGGMTQRQLEQLRDRRNRVCVRCLTVRVSGAFRYCDGCRDEARLESRRRSERRAS